MVLHKEKKCLELPENIAKCVRNWKLVYEGKLNQHNRKWWDRDHRHQKKFINIICKINSNTRMNNYCDGTLMPTQVVKVECINCINIIKNRQLNQALAETKQLWQQWKQRRWNNTSTSNTPPTCTSHSRGQQESECNAMYPKECKIMMHSTRYDTELWWQHRNGFQDNFVSSTIRRQQIHH